MSKTIRIIKKYGWCICNAVAALVISLVVTTSACVLLVFQALAWPFKFVVTKCIALDREYKLTEIM